jgi:hypothetical protein
LRLGAEGVLSKVEKVVQLANVRVFEALVIDFVGKIAIEVAIWADLRAVGPWRRDVRRGRKES